MIEEEAALQDTELSNALALAEKLWGDWTEAGIRATLVAQDKALYSAALAEAQKCRNKYHAAENVLQQLKKRRGMEA